MKEITEKIKIKEKVSIYKAKFFGSEVLRGVETEYHCCSCNHKNKIKIIPYDTGRYFGELLNNNILLKETILKNKMASEPKRNKHYGELLVGDLPTLYSKEECNKCEEKYLIVFGIGEKQPGMWLCEISGVWAYEKK